jgi:hypothetical protein
MAHYIVCPQKKNIIPHFQNQRCINSYNAVSVNPQLDTIKGAGFSHQEERGKKSPLGEHKTKSLVEGEGENKTKPS